MKAPKIEVPYTVKIDQPRKRGPLATFAYWFFVGGLWALFMARAMDHFPLWGASVLATFCVCGFHLLAGDYHNPRETRDTNAIHPPFEPAPKSS